MKLSIILIMSFLLSCNQERNFLIKKDGTQNYKLGRTLKDKHVNTTNIEIYTNTKDIITSILIKTKKYKTNEGFGVGSSFNDLRKGNKKGKIQKSTLSKNNIPIGNLGDFFVYDEIFFIDSNKDEIIDYVFVTIK